MAGSLQDIYNMMLTMVQSLNKLTTVVQNLATAGSVVQVNVGTSSAQCLPANAAKNTITFHNPSSLPIWIAPQTDNGGNIISLFAGGPGSFMLPPGDWVTLIGQQNVSVAYNAIAGGASASMTIFIS